MNAKLATLNARTHIPIAQTSTFTAHIGAADGDGFLLSTGVNARRAASCLLRPEPGDLVLCAQVSVGDTFILAVLTRDAEQACTLETPGPATLSANGPLTLQGTSLKLHSETSTTLRSQTLEAALDTAHVAGRELHVFAGTMKLAGSVLSSVMDRIQQFSRQYLRHTEALDRVSAAQVQVEAKQILQLHGEHVLVEGEDLIKARGSQIHFG